MTLKTIYYLSGNEVFVLGDLRLHVKLNTDSPSHQKESLVSTILLTSEVKSSADEVLFGEPTPWCKTTE
jgi:hypothetical protein